MAELVKGQFQVHLTLIERVPSKSDARQLMLVQIWDFSSVHCVKVHLIQVLSLCSEATDKSYKFYSLFLFLLIHCRYIVARKDQTSKFVVCVCVISPRSRIASECRLSVTKYTQSSRKWSQWTNCSLDFNDSLSHKTAQAPIHVLPTPHSPLSLLLGI